MISGGHDDAGLPDLAAMIIAGSDGRMHSARPKPLHLLCGRPMVRYVLDAVDGLVGGRIVVVARTGGDDMAKRLTTIAADARLVVVEQQAVGGSGDAVATGLHPFAQDLDDDDDIVILRADMPLLRPETVAELVRTHRHSSMTATMLVVDVDDAPTAPRLVADRHGEPARLVPPDALDGRQADTAAAGAYCFRRSLLAPALRRVVPDPDGMVALEGIIEVLTEAGHRIGTVACDDPTESSVVDDRLQLADAEAAIRDRTNRYWMAHGVTMVDPARITIDATVSLAPDVTLFPGTMLQGATVVGAGAEIGPDTRLVDCAIASGARVEMTSGRDAEVGPGAHVGPFAVLEPGSSIAEGVVTGPFHQATADQHEDS